MHGIGNDFVVVNALESRIPESDLPDLAVEMCARRTGVGSDGLIYLDSEPQRGLTMRMFNPDGSESEMCGNGLRCAAIYFFDEGFATRRTFLISMAGRPIGCEVLGDEVRISMGKYSMTANDIGLGDTVTTPAINERFEIGGIERIGTAIAVGNPHLIFFVDSGETIDYAAEGPQWEHHPAFQNRTNVHFVEVLSKDSVKQITWERGAGLTHACGSGACAAAVAGTLTGKSNAQVSVSLPGGNLQIDVLPSGEVELTGPAKRVYDGIWR